MRERGMRRLDNKGAILQQHTCLPFILLRSCVVVCIQGKLKGQGLDNHLPSIAVVAHYDAMGLATVRPLVMVCVRGVCVCVCGVCVYGHGVCVCVYVCGVLCVKEHF